MDKIAGFNHKNYRDYCIFLLTKNKDLKNIVVKYLQNYNVNIKKLDNNDICNVLNQHS
mgnify:CR=1 FL=1